MKYKILFSIFTILTLNFLANLAGEKKVMAATCKKIYKTEVIRRLINNDSNKNPVLTENDIRHLPIPIQNYIHYAGAVGRPKIGNMRMTFVGDFKIDIKKDWMKIKTEQYDFFSNPTRLFYIHGSMMFIPMSGWDFYTEGKGNMHVTIASLITVADIKGQEADIGELVTLFNDMCLVAPATLIDERIECKVFCQYSEKSFSQRKRYKIQACFI